MVCGVVLLLLPVSGGAGFKNVEALKKALLDNLRDSAIWGLT